MCALPIVMFDAIPGPERRNAARFLESSAGVLTNGPREAASTVLNLLRDASALHRMSSCAKRLARPDAAAAIVRLALDYNVPAQELARRMTA
jgi:UDP-N-acetylglucosamine:LPS N-acetylglucosamine transferase